MNSTVTAILPNSPAAKSIIVAGDVLHRINGRPVRDVLDYMFLSYDECLLLDFTGQNGKKKLVRLRKRAGTDPGLEFEAFLMDKERSCANRCIFCFIDQLPVGMRETLYYKDDDFRLSFFQGNYVTLTNLSESDIGRITRLRVSPINISVHTLDPDLRAFMLGIKNGATGVDAIKALARSGITLNCQIVCCPGINDGAELSSTMWGLMQLGDSVASVSIVPVGLTKNRQGLMPLRPFDRKLALDTVCRVEEFGEFCLKRRGSRVFFCADELYITAGLRLPPHKSYEDYPQLENGVGMMRLFITEFMEALRNAQFTIHNSQLREGVYDESGTCIVEFSIVTGVAAYKYLTKLLKIFTKKYDKMRAEVYPIRNEFFGESLTVSGLVTGGDIITQLKGCDLGSRVLIPRNMLRDGEDVFLDDISVAELSEALGVPVRVVMQDGGDLFRAMRETIEN